MGVERLQQQVDNLSKRIEDKTDIIDEKLAQLAIQIERNKLDSYSKLAESTSLVYKEIDKHAHTCPKDVMIKDIEKQIHNQSKRIDKLLVTIIIALATALTNIVIVLFKYILGN